MRQAFTPEELDELRRADAEIEREFDGLTEEELALSDKLDAVALLERMDNNGRKYKDRGTTYYNEHRQEVLDRSKLQYQARRDEAISRSKKYGRENKKKISSRKKLYYQTHKQQYCDRGVKNAQSNKELYADEQAVIATWRWRRGLTQKQLGDLLEISVAKVSAWERGARKANWDLLAGVFPELRKEA